MVDAPRFSADEVLEDYRVAVRSRQVDETERRLSSSGRAKFCILAGGTELPQLAAAREMHPGDWRRGYYRNGTEALALGLPVRAMIAQVIGDSEPGHDEASGGRMMGRHFGGRLLDDNGELIDLTQQVNSASDVSPTGSQLPVALGLARASRVFKEVPELVEHDRLSRQGREVALVTIGDSSMAEGPALEAASQAVVQGVPLVVSVLDNQYGISVPGDKQVPHGSVSKALAGLQGEHGAKIIGPVEGWDYAATRAAYAEAFAYTRETGRPAVVHALVTQPFGHSSSGDHARYKDATRLEFEKENDPIKKMRAWILEQGFANEDALQAIESEEEGFVRQETEAAWEAYYAPIRALAAEAVTTCERLKEDFPHMTGQIDTELAGLQAKLAGNLARSDVLLMLRRLLVSTRDGVQRETRQALHQLHQTLDADGRERFSSNLYADGVHSPLNAPPVPAEYGDDSPEDGTNKIIAAGLATMMQADSRVVVFGEDVGQIGGVINCTLGLQGGAAQVRKMNKKEADHDLADISPALARYLPEGGFGEARAWDHAIAEASIVGTAVGLALRGLRPVAEVQYLDYLIYALQQMCDELACLRHRTDGGQEAPVLIRTHGHRLLGMWHSGSPMGMILATCPGLRVLVPRNAVQAVGMYRAVLQGRDPAVSVDPLLQAYGGKERVPDNLQEICIPLGQSEILRPGDPEVEPSEQVTIVTYGQCCYVALEAAENLRKEGISVEVVDLQTLSPLDENKVALQSILRTGKVLFLDEDVPTGASAMIMKELITDRKIDGYPVYDRIERVDCLTAQPHKPAYGQDGGFWSKPQVSDVEHKVRTMLGELDGKGRAAW